MGSNCYCKYSSDPGSVPVPSSDKVMDDSNNVKNIEELNRQETYNHIFSLNKYEVNTVPSNKKEKEKSEDDNNDKNKLLIDISNFDNIISSYSKVISEEKFFNDINIKIKEIESKFGEINKSRKDDYLNNKKENIIYRPPISFKKNNKYFGSWNPNSIKKEGWGIFVDKDGNKYEGGWENDIIDGYGRIISINGDFYEGQIIKGIIEGNGLFYSQEKKMLYQGQFKNNLFEGKGEQNFENFGNEITYEGMFKKGKREGKGKILYGDGNMYEGEFFDDKFNGDGTFKWKDGRIYKGKWKDNQMNGKGIFKWDNNTFYEGDYIDNRREGFGFYHFNETSYYEGKWFNNMPHGKGKLVKDGTVLEGLFRFGNIIKNKSNKNCENNTGKIMNIEFKNEKKNDRILKNKKNSLK